MWTNQHGAGPKTDDRVETQVILQYMCQPFLDGKMPTGDVDADYEYHTIRNGQTATSNTFADQSPESHQISKHNGLHELYNYYQAYYRRYRNKGKISVSLSPSLCASINLSLVFVRSLPKGTVTVTTILQGNIAFYLSLSLCACIHQSYISI